MTRLEALRELLKRAEDEKPAPKVDRLARFLARLDRDQQAQLDGDHPAMQLVRRVG